MTINSQPSQPSQLNTQRDWLTEGVVIALFPIVSYAIAFLFWAGYFGHFGIHSGLIDIGVTDTLIAFFSLLSAVFIIYVIADFLYPILNIIPDPLIRGRLRLYLFLVLFMVTDLVIAHGKPAGLKYILGFAVILGFLDFVIPAIQRKDGRRYIERVTDNIRKDLARESHTDRLADKLGFNRFRLLAIVGALLFLSYSTGLGMARSQTEFFALQGYPNSVVLRISGTTLIWTSYNEKTNEISRSFTLEKLEGDKRFVLEKVKIGPLLQAAVIADTKGMKQK